MNGLLGSPAVDAARQKLKEDVYLPRIEAVSRRAQEEKDWIRECQGKRGEIYLSGGSSVNPYFACLAAQGLLSGQVRQEDLDAAQAYIDWHCQKFLSWDGEVPDFEIKGGREETKEPDSVDAYVAVFLSLLCKKAELTGRLSAGEVQAVRLGLEKLEELTTDGLTVVRKGDERAYYMDNLEVLAAYQDLQRAAGQIRGLEEFGRTAEARARRTADAIETYLWNEEEQRYEVGIQTDGRVMEADASKDFYPGGVIQVYGAAWGFPLSDQERVQALYRRFCRDFPWEKMKQGTFYWSELALAAAELGDLERAETYMETYQTLVEGSRSWPLHVGTAGWMAGACGRMEELYRQRLEGGSARETPELPKEEKRNGAK